jgi:alpha-ribazole phosphatase
MEIFLIRHGQTAGNRDRRYIGRTDEPLCEEGAAAAVSAGVYPEIRRVYVSPMRRARQTAELLFPNAEQVVCDGLREMDFGDFEGRNHAELESDGIYRAWLNGNCQSPCPHGEGVLGFSARVCAAFETITQNAACAGEEYVVIIAHGGTIMSLMSCYAAPERVYYAWYTENCHGFSARLSRREGAAFPTFSDWTEIHGLRKGSAVV